VTDPGWRTIAKEAEIRGLSPAALRSLCKSRGVTLHRIGRTQAVVPSEVDRCLRPTSLESRAAEAVAKVIGRGA
jgi:hypothetical protein